MRLSKHSDYALRVLMYLADHENETITTQQIASFHKISLNHLVKVVHKLSQAGFIHIRKGRKGGIWLAKECNKINLKEVVLLTEPNFWVAECFASSPSACVIFNQCRLKTILGSATESFLQHLEKYTLSSLKSSFPPQKRQRKPTQVRKKKGSARLANKNKALS